MKAVAPAWSANFVRDGNKVTCGEVRFDVLSPTLVRMQSYVYVDSPTAVVVNRKLSHRNFTVAAKGGWLTIKR